MRNWTAIGIILTLLASTLFQAVPPTLVCRATGEIMPPLQLPVEETPSCCLVLQERNASGAVQYRLAEQGCCALWVVPERAETPATILHTPDMPVAWLAPLPALPVLCWSERPVRRFLPASSIPRAPPGRSASPRAPPFFS